MVFLLEKVWQTHCQHLQQRGGHMDAFELLPLENESLKPLCIWFKQNLATFTELLELDRYYSKKKNMQKEVSLVFCRSSLQHLVNQHIA